MPRKKKQPYGLSAYRAARTYEESVKPYHEVWEKLRLPRRGPPGSDVNMERVAIVSRAMRMQRLMGKGGKP